MTININDPHPISPSKNTLVWIVGIGLLMENIDATIINQNSEVCVRAKIGVAVR